MEYVTSTTIRTYIQHAEAIARGATPPLLANNTYSLSFAAVPKIPSAQADARVGFLLLFFACWKGKRALVKVTSPT